MQYLGALLEHEHSSSSIASRKSSGKSFTASAVARSRRGIVAIVVPQRLASILCNHSIFSNKGQNTFGRASCTRATPGLVKVARTFIDENVQRTHSNNSSSRSGDQMLLSKGKPCPVLRQPGLAGKQQDATTQNDLF